MFKIKFRALTGAVIASILFTTACNTQPSHPNQVNTFDGASYDSLTVAHAALASLRKQVSATNQYVSVFNTAAAAYSTAFSDYSLYRANQSNQAAVAVDIANLTVTVVALENAFQAAMHVSPETVLKVRAKADRMRAAAAPRVSLSDILTELEIAASIAQTIPAAQPYAMLAAIVIDATRQAVAAQSSASGEPIDLSLIQPIAAIQ